MSQVPDVGVENRHHAHIGALLREIRLLRGLGQNELAERVGIASSYLSRIESGERRPAPRTLKRFAEALGHPYEELAVAGGFISASPAASVSTAQDVDTGAADGNQTTAMLRKLIAAIQEGDAVSPARRAIPVFDTVPAGLTKESNVVEAHADVPKLILSEEELAHDPRAFALIVRGDSMVEAGILEGDILVVSPKAHVTAGDIAVLQVNRKETTVKRVYIENDRIILQSANHRYKPLVLAWPDEAEILGKVILVRRKL